MKGQLRGLAGPMIKLVIFGLVTILASYVLVSTITNAGYGKQLTYKAQFTDVALRRCRLRRQPDQWQPQLPRRERAQGRPAGGR